jgi:hypothetical protein
VDTGFIGDIDHRGLVQANLQNEGFGSIQDGIALILNLVLACFSFFVD